MHVMVLGANGLLGSQVVATAQTRDWPVTGTFHTQEPVFDADLYQLDIRNEERFASLLESVDPAWVVNCAAMTDVDSCEEYPATAQEVNGLAPGELAKHCRARDVGFVNVSTDYVFDGEADDPYAEDDEPNPVQSYGESKLGGERAVREADESALTLRLSFVYGVHGATGELTGFPAWVRSQLADGGETPLFADQWVTPTRAGHAAETILDLIGRGASGTFHVASRSCVTPLEFGAAIRERMAESTGPLIEGSMDDVDRAARRPRYTCLDVSGVEAKLNRPQPSLEEDLDAIAGAF